MITAPSRSTCSHLKRGPKTGALYRSVIADPLYRGRGDRAATTAKMLSPELRVVTDIGFHPAEGVTLRPGGISAAASEAGGLRI